MAVVFGVFTGSAVSVAASQYTDPTTGAFPTTLKNGDFEMNTGGTGGTQLMPAASGAYTWDQSYVPGWSTTEIEADGVTRDIEQWYTGGGGFQTGNIIYKAASGDWMAEINANKPGSLYQDLSTTVGAIYKWSVDHGGRVSATVPDTATVSLNSIVQETMADTNGTANSPGVATWNAGNPAGAGLSYSGYYQADSATTCFSLDAISAAASTTATVAEDDLSVGNLVDNARWTPIAAPGALTITRGDSPTAGSLLQSLDAADGYGASYYAYSTGNGGVYSPLKPGDIKNLLPGSYLVKIAVTDSDGHQLKDANGAFLTVTSTLKVTAPPISTWTVTFTDGLGNTLAIRQVNNGGAATAPNNPTRAGYVFTGWDTVFGNVTNNIVVTAKWIPYWDGSSETPQTPPVAPLSSGPDNATPPPGTTAPDNQQPVQPRIPATTTTTLIVTQAEQTTGGQKTAPAPGAGGGNGNGGGAQSGGPRGFSAQDQSRLAAQTGSPLADLAAGNVPAGNVRAYGVWSFLSLILAALGIFIVILAATFAARNRRSEQTDTAAEYADPAYGSRRRTRLVFLLLTIASGVAVPVCWLIFDTLTLPVAFLNFGTPTVAIFFALCLVMAAVTLAIHRRKE
ncbi:MAG: InlB B-repeat-containing protein, partial [Clostridiales bacterium]|nr:InlB B-repeat-containing protein [Clostridiales bacterium]